MRSFVFYAIAPCLAATVSAGAVELRPIEVRKGTDGLDPAPLTVVNRSSQPIVCIAEIAHWYSAELGRAPAGGNAEIPLWRDGADGAYVALNDKQENMPVEKLWCGFAGGSYETRAEIVLDRALPVRPAETMLECREASRRLSCG